MFEGFKAVLCCRVVVCKDNSKGERCGVSVCCCRVVVVLWIVWCLVVWVVDRLRDWEMRELPRTFYPKQKRSFCDRVLTVAHTPAIHETVYLILVF